ncbi:MAG: PH domain-containing protein [Nocardioidaceae bacterium]
MKESAADRLFAEPGLSWHSVSPKLVTERRLMVAPAALVGLALVVTGVVLGLVGPAVAGLVLGLVGVVLLVLAALAWFVVVPRMVRSWRYAERSQDLLVSHGRLLRRLSVVPYGRMQVIEVSANPVSRRLGIATVTLVTASATTDARIPGLPVDTAHEIRDRLAAKGEALTAGL